MLNKTEEGGGSKSLLGKSARPSAEENSFACKIGSFLKYGKRKESRAECTEGAERN